MRLDSASSFQAIRQPLKRTKPVNEAQMDRNPTWFLDFLLGTFAILTFSAWSSSAHADEPPTPPIMPETASTTTGGAGVDMPGVSGVSSVSSVSSLSSLSGAKNQPVEDHSVQAARTKRHPWPIFDPFLSSWFRQFSAGVGLLRPWGDSGHKSGLILSVGEGVQDRRRFLFAEVRRATGLMVLGGPHFGLQLSSFAFEGGLSLGPIELGAGPGLTLLGAEYCDKMFSFSLLSPRVGVRAAVRVGGFKVGASGYSEYLWRWLGRNDGRMTGITLDVQPDTPSPVRSRRVVRQHSPER